MTSAQTMLSSLAAITLAVLGFSQTGCATPGLTPPTVLVAPYDASEGEALWAIAPLRNESGLSQMDPLVVTDELVAAAQQTRGVRCLPVNRVIAAMRALEIDRIEGPEQAQQIAQSIGVDALIVGAITAYDAYTPVVGLSIALYARPGPLFFSDHETLDSR